METTFVKGKNLINEEVAKINSFKELTFFFSKNIFNYKTVIGSLIIILIIFFGMIPQIPFSFAFSTTENLSLFIISSMIYGSTFYTFRKSTIFENTRETNLNKKEIYLSIFITMFLFTGVMYLFIISIFIIFISTNSTLLLNDWPFLPIGTGANGKFLNEINIQLLFWWYFSFILINFALFYFFQNISSTKKGFYLFIFIYIILLIIWGNIAIPPQITINYDELFLAHPELVGTENDAGKLWNLYHLDNAEVKFLLWHFEVSGQIVVSTTIKTKYLNGHYVAAIISILVPHSWINTYCAAIWKATAIKSYTTLDFQLTQDGVTKYYHPDLLLYQDEFLKNAPIWKIKGQIWWSLGMYLWMVYFIIISFAGTAISRIKNM